MPTIRSASQESQARDLNTTGKTPPSRQCLALVCQNKHVKDRLQLLPAETSARAVLQRRRGGEDAARKTGIRAGHQFRQGRTMQGLSLPIPKENQFKYTTFKPIESHLEELCGAQTERLGAKLHVSLAKFILGLCEPNGMLQQLDRSPEKSRHFYSYPVR